MKNTKIDWCDHTFNPWIGCTKISPGCEHCYAAAQDVFRKWTPQGWGKGNPRKRTGARLWRGPVEWNQTAICDNCGAERGFAAIAGNLGKCSTCHKDTMRKPRVFSGSLCDIFDDEVSAEWLADFLKLIDECRNLDFLLLTKRPALWRPRLEEVLALRRVGSHGGHCLANRWLRGEAPVNVLIGATAENQAMFDDRVSGLRQIPARARFLSCEPLIGPIDLLLRGECSSWACPVCGSRNVDADKTSDEGKWWECLDCHATGEGEAAWKPDIHQVICGGESGSEARPMHPDWARSLRDQCAAADVPFLFKQWGEWAEATVDNIDASKASFFLEADGTNSTDWTIDRHSIRTAHMGLLGKKRTGRLLDAKEHNGFPIIGRGN